MKRQGLFGAATLCALGAAGAAFIACTDYYTDLLDESAHDIGDSVVSQVVENLDKIDMNMPQLQELKDKFVGERDAIADKLGLTETERDAIAGKLGITQDDLAKKIEENKGLITEVNNITTERDNYIDRWNTTVIERDKVKDDLDKTTTTLDETKALLEAAGLREETLKQNVADTEDKLQKKKDELAEALAGNSALEGEKKTLTDELADAVADAEAKKTEIADLNGKITDLNDKQKELIAERDEAAKKAQELSDWRDAQTSSGLNIGGIVMGKTSTVNIIPPEAIVGKKGEKRGVFIEGRTVKLSPYAINKYEVTREMFCTVMGRDENDSHAIQWWGWYIDSGNTVPTSKNEDPDMPNVGEVCDAFCCTKCMLRLYHEHITSYACPPWSKSWNENTKRFDKETYETQKYRCAFGMNWYDAIAFCNKLSIIQGYEPCYTVSSVPNWANLKYEDIPTTSDDAWNAVKCDFTKDGWRLPTEAEWEFAARGGDPNAPDWNYMYSGSNNIDEVAWWPGNSGLIDNERHEGYDCFRHMTQDANGGYLKLKNGSFISKSDARYTKDASGNYTVAANGTFVVYSVTSKDGAAVKNYAQIADASVFYAPVHHDAHGCGGYQRNHETGRKKPNRLGLYDMSGNGEEWCWDKREKIVAGTVTDPKGSLGDGGKADGAGRIIRGGDSCGCGINIDPEGGEETGDSRHFEVESKVVNRGSTGPWNRCHTSLRYCRTIKGGSGTVMGDGGSK